MNILFLGQNSGTARHRVEAMKRLGHGVHSLDPTQFVPRGISLLTKLHYETGGLLCEETVTRCVLGALEQIAGTQTFEMVWVENGRYVGPSLVRALRNRFHCPIMNSNNDDPYGGRDRFSWALFLRTVPEYDLLVVPRKQNLSEAQARGGRRVIFHPFAADEVAHAPHTITAEEYAQWRSDVVFVGTWMPERGPFMKTLVEKRVPLTIYGNRWNRAPEWPILKPHWKGPGTKSDREYACAIQSAQICLGLLSKGNRDFHTQRSMEVPALGGLLCAERTEEHQALYCEGVEAAFWDDAEECAEVCFPLLASETTRQKMAAQGHARCLKNGHFNERVCTKILEEVQSL